MMVRKAFAIGCIAFILGAQAWTIFPPGRAPRNRYWPFLDYPMYGNAHHRGDSIVLQDLRAVRCDSPDTAVIIPASALRVQQWRYWTMLDRLAHSPDGEPMLDTLGYLTHSAAQADVCALEVWRQVLVVERRGVRLEDHPWIRFRRWTIGPDSGRRALAPSGPRQ